MRLAMRTRIGRFSKHLPIDNNLTEQFMKQVAIGRKNWLFIGSLAAGGRTANLMTLVSNAIRNDLHVWPRMREPASKEYSTPCWPAQRTTIPSAPTSGPPTILITSAPTARMSVEIAPTANSALVKKEETPRAELNHCRRRWWTEIPDGAAVRLRLFLRTSHEIAWF